MVATRGADNVRVAVRVRPASLREKCGVAYRSMVKVVDEKMITFDPEDALYQVVSGSSRLRGRARVGTRRVRNMNYAYDHVFGEDCGQHLIFERTTLPLVESATRGFKATVFAYGATGSGKVRSRTHRL